MSNLIRGEFYKLRKSKYFAGMILLSLLIGFYLMIEWDNHTQRLKITSPDSINGLNSISYSFQLITIISFMFALLAVEFIVKDFKNSNMSKSFIYGYTRNTVLLSKLIVFTLFSLLLELIYTIPLVIYASLNHGFWGNLDVNNLYLIRLLVVGILYNMATIFIIVIVAVITKSTLFTITSPIILIASFLLATSHPYFITKIFFYMPHTAGLDGIAPFSPSSCIIKSLISSSITFIITIGGSLLYIKHKDIK
ncbi:ABC transporter permease [Clostridium sp. SHJSY1]|uniref:ABC transporter permease n=1 Tax=Clostridium sp. SHJSY1 TaxID=2942483 RepID=UPI0028769AB1|nr:ABC transporter permease [Clostridium sp. SHJSY1]MDS0527268.1 ABC transporter permease [Clostridium sp. SHJSY1]